MANSKLTKEERLKLIHDLALSPKTQAQLAQDYGISQNSVSRIKREESRDIERIQDDYLEQATGQMISNLEWRMKELEKAVLVMGNKRSPEFVRAKVMALHEAAEQLGQLPPRMQINIIPVEHKLSGIDINEAFGIEDAVDAEVIDD